MTLSPSQKVLLHPAVEATMWNFEQDNVWSYSDGEHKTWSLMDLQCTKDLENATSPPVDRLIISDIIPGKRFTLKAKPGKAFTIADLYAAVWRLWNKPLPKHRIEQGCNTYIDERMCWDRNGWCGFVPAVEQSGVLCLDVPGWDS